MPFLHPILRVLILLAFLAALPTALPPPPASALSLPDLSSLRPALPALPFRKWLREPFLVLGLLGLPVRHPLTSLLTQAFAIGEIPPDCRLSSLQPARVFSPLIATTPGTANPARSRVILNGNLWLLPFLPLKQGARIDTFARLVRAWNPDILLLQEVWVYHFLEDLRRRLPEYYCTVSELALHNRTGLVIFSKEAPEQAEFGLFTPSWHQDAEEIIGDKGLLRVSLPVNGRRVWFVSTHLNAPGNDPANRLVTNRQFAAVKAVMSAVSEPVFIGGDLNTTPEMLAPLNAGCFTFAPDPTPTTQHQTNARRIDYVFWRGTADATLAVDSRVLRDPPVSDHCLLLATCSLRADGHR